MHSGILHQMMEDFATGGQFMVIRKAFLLSVGRK